MGMSSPSSPRIGLGCRFGAGVAGLALKAPVPGTKIDVYKRLVLSVLLYGCETRTLTAALRSRMDSFRTKSLRLILGYRWFDFVLKDRLLEKTSMTKISKLVFERQMSMYSHMARLPLEDPAHKIVSCSNPLG